MYPLPTNPNTPEHLVEQENCIDSVNEEKFRSIFDNFAGFFKRFFQF